MSAPPRLSGNGAEKLRSSAYRIAITGAGGWVGLATLELLHNTLGREAFAERVCAFGSARRKLELGNGIHIKQRPLSELCTLEKQPTLLLHTAFLTKDRAEWMDEQEYVEANLAIRRMVLEALDPIGVEGLFVASSGAARFADDERASAAMRLYGALKRTDEQEFAAWAEQRGKRAVICRMFNLSGPHINKHQTYALASFILNALNGRPIEVRATRRVVRGYVAIREVMSLVFSLLLDGGQGVTRLDTGGTPMEMQEIAERVAALLGPVPVEHARIGAECADEYVGDDTFYRRLLVEHAVPSISFEDQVIETAGFIAAGYSQSPIA